MACSSNSDTFVIEGKFKNFNQGTLYVYNMDIGRGRVDTVKLAEGKFVYETEIDDTVALSFIFPNYSEIPVFAYPGAKVSMNGDASNLKEVTVTGTEENNLMSELQLKLNELSPPKATEKVVEFVRQHPTSPVSLYLIRKHFLLTPSPDYKQATELLTLMKEATPKNIKLNQLLTDVTRIGKGVVGQQLPPFSAVTIDGARVSNSDLNGTVNVVCAWTSWNFDSQHLQRQLKPLKREFGSRLQIISLCLDATVQECRTTMRRDSITWYTVCDGQLWQSPAVDKLGITEIPTLLIVDRKGTIVARNLSIADMREKIRGMMK